MILEFLDRYNFDLGKVKRSCVHFTTPDGQIIPFDTYNTFYRPGRRRRGGGRTASGAVGRAPWRARQHRRRGNASVKSGLGGILLALGILIGGLSGLCTLVVVGSSLMDSTSEDFVPMIPAVLMVGGIPFVIGIGLFFLGRHLMRTARQDKGPDDPSVTFK